MRKKSDSSMRWVVLFLNCVLMVCVYFSFDIPAAMKSQLEDYMGDDNFETWYSFLYTLPAFPNMILPFFGGYFVDKLGVRSCLIVFVSIIAIGQVVFSFGLSIKSWPVMLLGRAIVGCGETSNSVANSAIVAEWFQDKELAFAFGFNLSVARLGSVTTNFVSPLLALSGGVVLASWFGSLLLGIGVVSVLLMLPIDTAAEKLIREDPDGKLRAQSSCVEEALLGTDTSVPNSEKSEESASEKILETEENAGQVALSESLGSRKNSSHNEIQLSNVFKFKFPYWMLSLSCLLIYGVIIPFNNIAGTLLLERNFFMEPPDRCVLSVPYECQSSSNKPIHCPSSNFYQPPLPENITIDNDYYKKVEPSDVHCADDVWKDECTEQFCDRHASGILRANTIMSIPYFMAAVLFPVCGQLVDWYGFRAVGLVVAPAVLVVVHALLGFTRVDPIPLMVGQGLAYSIMASALWPSVPLVVDPANVGLAYGAAFSMQNVGLTVIPLVMASIYASSGNTYIPNVEVFLVCVSGVACLVGLWLCRYDYTHGGDLNAPMKSTQEEYIAIADNGKSTCPENIFEDDGQSTRKLRVSRNSGASEASAHSELLNLKL